MKTIQKITLGLLTVGAFTASGFAAQEIELNVDTGSATHSGLINATLAKKTGAGILALSNATNAISVLEIQEGQVDIAATGNFGGTASFTTNAGNKLNMVGAGVNVPALTMTVAGTLDCNGNATNLAGVPAGAALLSVSGGDILTVAVDASASTTPMNINSDATVAVGAAVGSVASPKLPASAIGVSGILEITAAAAGCVPGNTTVASAGVVAVDAGLAVPGHGGPGTSDVFGNLLFQTGSILRLGNGSSWARNITVGAGL
jgi:hypothetical protein